MGSINIKQNSGNCNEILDWNTLTWLECPEIGSGSSRTYYIHLISHYSSHIKWPVLSVVYVFPVKVLRQKKKYCIQGWENFNFSIAISFVVQDSWFKTWGTSKTLWIWRSNASAETSRLQGGTPSPAELCVLSNRNCLFISAVDKVKTFID